MIEKINLKELDTVDANILVKKYRQELDDSNFKVLVLSEQLNNYKKIIEQMQKEHPQLFK